VAKDLYIDMADCNACEACVEACSKVFAIDPATGKAKALNPEGASEEEIQSAMSMCPAGCIHWEDDQ